MGVGPPCSSPCQVLPLLCGGGHPCAQALTLQLRTLMALALAPGGADAPAAVFLLGEAREGIAAALGEVGTEVTGRPAPPGLPPRGLFLPSARGPPFCASPIEWGQGNPETQGPVQLDCGVTHGLLGQCVLEAAAQGLLGGWPGVLGLGVRQQVLRGGGALGIRPLDAVHLDRGLGRMVDAHVHHGGRGLHWGAGHGGFRAVPHRRFSCGGGGCVEWGRGCSSRSRHPSVRPLQPPRSAQWSGTFR